MRWITLAISALLFGIYFYYGHSTGVAGLPPVVEFFNPYTGWWQNAERPNLAKRLFTGPNEKEVTIGFDERGVPHVFASSFEDAVYAQGILHAHFRLWQMEMTERATVGSLSEVMGKTALEHDIEQRRIGLRELSQRIAKGVSEDEDTRNLSEIYCAGANAVIEKLYKAAYPLEYKLMDFEPKKWTPLRSAAVAAGLTKDLCLKHFDVPNTEIAQRWGYEYLEKYFPDEFPNQIPIVHKQWDKKRKALPASGWSSSNKHFPGSPFPQPDPGLGSNNWAISSSKTEAQKPILANDPHLRLTLPSVWYEIHFHIEGRNIYGVSFPGIPGIVLGFSDDLAWGSTNVSHDVADWGQLIWNPEDSTEYLYEGEWRSIEIREEVIHTRDGDSMVLEIPVTALGHIPYYGQDHPQKNQVFQWLPLSIEEGNLQKAFLDYNRARNYSSFEEGLRNFSYPAQNKVFAGHGDTIGIHVQGALPIRKFKGKTIVDSLQTPFWKGMIPEKMLPMELNPSRGYVSSANQHSTNSSYPYYYQGIFEDYRGRTLDSLLRTDNRFTVEKVKGLQLSVFSLHAKENVPLLLQFLNSKNKQTPTAQLLEEWDYNYGANSNEAVFYDLLWNQVVNLTFEEFTNFRSPDDWVLTQLLKEGGTDTIFYHHEHSNLRTAADVIDSAWSRATHVFDSLGRPNWSDYRNLKIPHLGRIDAFSSEDLELGGTSNALNAIRQKSGPSWRMIVEIGKPMKAYGVYPGGQSGNPGSVYYDNFVEDWANGKYYPLQLPEDPSDSTITVKWSIKKSP